MEIRQVLQQLHQQLYLELNAVLVNLHDEQIRASAPAIDARSIGEVAIHAHRPILAVVCAMAGIERPPRPDPPATVATLLPILQDMAHQVNVWVAALPDEAWQQKIALPWGNNLVALDAYLESITHGLVHVGRIGGMRAIIGAALPPEA